MSDRSEGGQALPSQWLVSDDLFPMAIAPKTEPAATPATPTPSVT